MSLGIDVSLALFEKQRIVFYKEKLILASVIQPSN